MPVQLGLKLLVANVWSQEKEMDTMGLKGQNNRESGTIVPTETCLQHILDQADAVDKQTVFWAVRVHEL